MEHIKNKQYEILTPSGWKSFSGMRKLSKSEYATISTETTELKCSLNHKLKTKDGWKKSKELLCGDSIVGVKESSQISFVDVVEDEIDLFDILEVENHEYYSNGLVSHNCDFVGSQNTLISSVKLRSMNWSTPTSQDSDGLWIYEEPKEDHDYFITVDTARGQGKDYSAFVVIDATEMPYKLVARYKNNTISPMVYPTVIRAVGLKYNTAGILIEINDIGGQVADILHQDLEYENVMMTTYKGRAGQVMSAGFGGNSSKSQLGVRTTVPVKKLGCSILKSLIEEDKLIVEDVDCVNELITFVAKGKSFEADDGHTDDLVMSLVLFAWMTRQEYFKSLTDSDIRTQIYEEQIRGLEEDILPFGFITEDIDEGEWDGESRWFPV